MTEELAIIKDVSFGVRDSYRAALWFTAEMLHGSALLCIDAEKIVKIIEKNFIKSIEDLEGTTCIVDGGGSRVNFVKFTRYPD